MKILRWAAGITSVLTLLMLGLILIVGEGLSAFRSGSDDGDWKDALMLLGAVLLPSGVLALSISPESKTLAWIAGGAVALGAVGCLTLLRDHPAEASVYLLVLGVWLALCWTAVRSAANAR